MITVSSLPSPLKSAVRWKPGLNVARPPQVSRISARTLATWAGTAGCAEALGVSSDWLLGLADRPERPGDVIEAALSMTQADRTSADAQLLDWHREASGYKVRHVPATLPDMLKTEDGTNLLQGIKRAANILSQAEEKDGVEYAFGADPKFAETDEERALFAALDAAEPKIAAVVHLGHAAATNDVE